MTVQSEAIPPFPRAAEMIAGTGGEGCAPVRGISFILREILAGGAGGGSPPPGPTGARGSTDPRATGGSPHSDLPIRSFMISFVPP